MKTLAARVCFSTLAFVAFALQPARCGEPGNGATTGAVMNSDVKATDDATANSSSTSSKPVEKIYYTTQWIKVEDDNGVTGVPVGTKVTVAGKAKIKGDLKVKTAEDLVFEVTPDQITEDPEKAAALAQEEAAKKAAQDAAAAQAALQAATTPPAPTLNLAAIQAPPQSTAPSSGGLGGTSLDKGAYNSVTSPKPKPTPRPPPIQVINR